MENVTHSLIGFAIGQALAPKAARTSAGPNALALGAGRAVLLAAIIGSNIPDADFILGPLMGSDGMGSLLHHRGYTHTFLAVPIEALLSAWVGALIAHTPISWRAFFAASIGVLLHIFADYWVDYGVHPFSPFLNRWYYGDVIFIWEPLLWAALFAWALPQIVSQRWAWLLRGLWAGTAMLVGISGYFPVRTKILYALLSLAFVGLNRVAPRWLALAASLGVVFGLFGSGAERARALVRAALPGGEQVISLVLTQAPANPGCARAITVTRAGDEYVMRLGEWGLEGCYPRLGVGQGNAPLDPVQPLALQKGSPRFRWLGEFRRSWAEWESFQTETCRSSAFIRFARAPFWTLDGMMGDLRYDHVKGPSFSAFSREATQNCAPIPPWDPPTLEKAR